MEKRLFIAILISFLVLLGWSWLAPRLFPELARQKAAVADAKRDDASAPVPAAATPQQPLPASSTTAPAAASSTPAVAAEKIADSRKFDSVIDRPAYRATFTNQGAQLTSFLLKNHKEKGGAAVDLVKNRPATSHDFPFALLSADPAWNAAVNSTLFLVDRSTKGGIETLRFTATDPAGHRVTKTFSFDDTYYFSYAIDVANRALPYRVEIGPGIRSTVAGQKTSQLSTTGNAVVQKEGSLEKMDREKTSGFHPVGGPVEFVGVDDNYFLSALKPERGGDAAVRVVTIPPAAKDAKPTHELYIGSNAVSGSASGHAYFGPKETEILDQFGFGKVIQYGQFGFIARILLKALNWVNGFTHNYGWAIVVLTIIIKLLLYPLQHKSIVSMKKMQQVQPKVNAIKEKYRKAKTDPDQRQKMNVEMMKLYQVEGISPVSGCLPILLQLPILWAFYALLSSAIELRGAPFFGWITDLSAKDPYYITPLLMMATMFIQQWITPSTVDPVQKKMFMIMPLVFGFIFKEFPSGLVLYWLVQNVLTIVQQLIMNRYWKDHPEALKKA
jgi:YidC/Oxa1 family membrane protein insertase